jgi:Zn-dependent protease with chaperone function
MMAGVAKPLTASDLRHPKEVTYLAIGAIVGGIVWLLLLPIILMFVWLLIPVVIVLWITEQFFRAELLGNSVKVSDQQYPEIHAVVKSHARILNLGSIPEVFVVNSQGAINALAVKFVANKYVILYSSLIDVMLAHGSAAELSMVIGHELGHHAAGHLAWWKTFLLKPAMFIPFFGAAYSRACELTADRIGLYLCGDLEAARRGLIALASGSMYLAPKTSIQMFTEQERAMPPLFGFIHNLFATHPRITRRVLAMEEAKSLVGGTQHG